MPGYALSPSFRAKMRDALRRAGLGEEVDARVWRRRWTVHVQQIGTGAHAAQYLSRYVYRVALTNQRLVRFADGQVTVQYTHARSQERRRITLPVDAFLSRFLEHVLPRGFTKIRWYGLLSPGRRAELERARELLTTQPGAAAPAVMPASREPLDRATVPSRRRCLAASSHPALSGLSSRPLHRAHVLPTVARPPVTRLPRVIAPCTRDPARHRIAQPRCVSGLHSGF